MDLRWRARDENGHLLLSLADLLTELTPRTAELSLPEMREHLATADSHVLVGLVD